MSGSKKCVLFGVVLFVSLALNVLAAGYFIAKPDAPHVGGKHKKQPHFERMAEQAKHLPAEQQREVLDIIAVHREEVRKAFREKHEAIDNVLTYLKSEDYNRAEAEQRFAELGEVSHQAYRSAQLMMLDIADVLPPESRALMVPKPKYSKGTWGKRTARPAPPAQEE